MNEKKKDDILGSHQSIKMDILIFKDDILKDMRSIQKSLDLKYKKAEDNLNIKINDFESKIVLFEKKIFELSNKINTDNKIRKDVEELNKYKEEISDTLLKRRVKYNEFEKRMNEEINRFNDILLDSVIYPGIIGNSTKFKTFHEFIDYTLEEISQCKLFRDKSGLDIGPFKKKIDQSIDAIRLQMTNMNNGTKEYASNSIEQCEERLKNLLKIYDDRLQDTRVENSHYSIGIEKKAEELKKEINNLKLFQSNIIKEYENQKKENKLKNYDKDISGINNRLNKMNSLLKEIISLLGMKGPKEKKNKIYSGVKQYIQGYLNADELFNVKKFHFSKSKTKRYDDYSFGQNIKRTETEISKKESFILRNDSNIKSNSTKKEPFKRLLTNSFKLNNTQNNENINNEISRTETFINTNKLEKENNIEKTFNKRKSCNYNNLTSVKKYQFNDEIENEQNSKNNKNKIDNKITNEQQKSNNKLKFISSSESDSKNENESILNLSKESSLSKKKKNQYIIKEEDENNISEKSKEEFENINKEGKVKNDKKTFQNINNKKKINNYAKSESINICIKPKINHDKIINMKKEFSRNNIRKKNENNYVDKNVKNEESIKNKDKINTSDNTHNLKIGLNILDNNNNNNRKYLLGINYNENEEQTKIRCKSSKKRNLYNNNSIFLNDNYKSIKKEKRDIYNSFNLPYNSYSNNTYNFIRNNNLYPNYPKINNENLKLESNPNFNNNKAYSIKNKSAYNRQKKLRLGNPESPFNSVYKENKRISNKSFRTGNERALEAREIENMFNNLQSYISSYEPNLKKDIAFKNLKSHKNQNI